MQSLSSPAQPSPTISDLSESNRRNSQLIAMPSPCKRRRDHDSVEDQSDPFVKLKSSGGVASLTDREIFDMWRAMRGGKTYFSKEDEDKAYSNFRLNIRDAPANEDQYAYNCHQYADLSKEEIAQVFRTWGWSSKRDLYNAYIFKSNIEKWPGYAKTVYSRN